MKVKDFFKEKYFGYELIFKSNEENGDDNIYVMNEFYIKNNNTVYIGLCTNKERKEIDSFIEFKGQLDVRDFDVDKVAKQVFIELKQTVWVIKKGVNYICDLHLEFSSKTDRFAFWASYDHRFEKAYKFKELDTANFYKQVLIAWEHEVLDKRYQIARVEIFEETI